MPEKLLAAAGVFNLRCRRAAATGCATHQAILALLSRFGPVRITHQEPGVRHLEVELGGVEPVLDQSTD